MRVLVCTVVHVASDARIRHRQIAALLEAGHAVTYAAPFTPEEAEQERGVERLTTIGLPRARERDRLSALRVARQVLADHAPGHDLVLVHDPELLALLPALRRLPPVVWDVHEDLAGSLADKPWLPRPVRRPLASLVRSVERVVEQRVHVLLAEHAYQTRFPRLHPVVPNVPPLPPQVGPAGARDEVVHLGRVSRLRGAAELVAVGERLAGHGIALQLLGPVDAEVRPQVESAHDRGAVVMHGFVPNDRALARLDGAIAGLALLHDHPNYRSSLPTKLVEYQAAGIPVVTTPLPQARRVVELSAAGAVVPFGDVDAVVAQVEAWAADRPLVRQLGERARRAAEDHWSWAAHAPAFVAQLERWASPSAERRRRASIRRMR